MFEESTRVFLPTCLWNMSPSRQWRWFGIAVSVVLFGLIHVYQRPGGMVLTGTSGLIYAVTYYHAGRVVPLMIARYLHDAMQFAAVFITANST